MIVIVYAFPDPPSGEDVEPAVRAIFEAVKPKIEPIPGVQGYIASHGVADQIVSLFKAEGN
jgi:hypothetical protein